MRVELLDPAQTLSMTTYSRILALHALSMVGVLVAAFIAIPTLVIRPGRGAIMLGGIALAVWAAVMAFFIIAPLGPDDGMTGWLVRPGSLRFSIMTLAIGVGVAASSLAVSLPANVDIQSRRVAVAAIGAIIALAVVGIPLASGEFPTTLHLLTASTLVVCGLVPASLGSAAASIMWLAVAPCLVAAWIAIGILHAVDISFLPDTVAMVAPLPAMGGAVLAALFVAACRERTVPRGLTRVAAVIFASGAIVTSTAFLLLGARGFPRRYQEYDAIFQPLQILVGVAAAVTFAGAIVAISCARTSPRTASASSPTAAPRPTA